MCANRKEAVLSLKDEDNEFKRRWRITEHKKAGLHRRPCLIGSVPPASVHIGTTGRCVFNRCSFEEREDCRLPRRPCGVPSGQEGVCSGQSQPELMACIAMHASESSRA